MVFTNEALNKNQEGLQDPSVCGFYGYNFAEKIKNKPKIAFFDIDGTIFRTNLHYELLDDLSFAGIFSKESRRQVVTIYRKWLENRGTYETYKDQLVGVYREEIKGKKEEDVLKIAKKVAAFYYNRVFIYTKRLIERLRKDYVLLAISGSPIEIVKEFSSYFGFNAAFGTVYEIGQNGRYTGVEAFLPTLDKAVILKDFIKRNGLSLNGSIGVGDTESDIPMLELAERPIAFNPNLNLYLHAKKKSWEIVVERKDVIYRMINAEGGERVDV